MTNQHMPKAHPARRFWAMVIRGSGCWIWIGARSREGYGFFSPTHAKQVRAHRYAYELERGPIPDGKQLDHLCRTPSCVRPDHLEIVTSRENTLRGGSPTAQNAKKTHCKNGHLLAGSNLVVRSLGRGCQTCRQADDRRRYHRAKADACPALRAESK